MSLKLMEAVKSNDMEKARFLLERKVVDVNFEGNFGNTSLHIAVRNGSLEMVKLLLEFGAAMKKDYFGHTPSTEAEKLGYGEIHRVLRYPERYIKSKMLS